MIARLITLGLLVVAPTALAAPKPLTPVKLFFIEALDPTDTTSSERFRKEYVYAIAKGKEFTAQKLAACGYALSATTYFYGASDPIQATEQAHAAAKQGAWMIVGPRRSNHYLLLAKGAPSVPSVSLMASSEEVAALGDLHLSLVPSNSVMARTAAEEAASRIKAKTSKTYMSVISGDCVACKDFAKQFDTAAAKFKLKKSAEVFVLGEQPDLTALKAEIAKTKPDFLLVPNYSIVSSHIIAGIHAAFPSLFFISGDTWGDSNFGFVKNGQDIGNAKGFTVRGNPSANDGMKTFEVGRAALKAGVALGSSSALMILRAFDSTAQLLCDSKPKTASEYAKAFEKTGRHFFSAPWGTSIFNLDQGNIIYLKSRGGSR